LVGCYRLELADGRRRSAIGRRYMCVCLCVYVIRIGQLFVVGFVGRCVARRKPHTCGVAKAAKLSKTQILGEGSRDFDGGYGGSRAAIRKRRAGPMVSARATYFACASSTYAANRSRNVARCVSTRRDTHVYDLAHQSCNGQQGDCLSMCVSQLTMVFERFFPAEEQLVIVIGVVDGRNRRGLLRRRKARLRMLN
jgi:hypothetical protein